ncbi:MAG TPA: Fe-S cluster assembly protein SufD [Candidatus Thermoplasmatota archaeon]|nr:Fe-S cluster assembly protein SufD [Candidatus Thermoplasmatota archaeon]
MSQAVTKTDFWAERFRALEAALPGAKVAWVAKLRQAALARFLAKGFPTTKVEAWKYTDVSAVAKTAWTPAGPARADHGALAPYLFPGADEGARIVLVDGRHAPTLSDVSRLPAGVTVESLSSVLAKDPKSLEGLLGSEPVDEDDAFEALNTAFFADGVVVRVARGAVAERPIHVVHYQTGAERAFVASRVFVVAEASSQASVVETHAGPAGAYLSTAVTEILARENAVVEHLRVQRESDAATHVARTAVRQGRSSTVTTNSVSIGASLARHNLVNVLDGEGAYAELDGLFLVTGRQHVDNHTLIDHAKPHCGSREFYKGVATGHARGVFLGRIIVRPDAQKTDAKQTNKNLILSKDALIDSTPQLEIYADDVKCTHGSTTGQISADALFYLRARGIPEGEARAILVRAFAGDVLARIKHPAVRERVEALVAGWLDREAREA